MELKHNVTREIFDSLQSCGGLKVKTSPDANYIDAYVSGWALWAERNKAAKIKKLDVNTGKMKSRECDLSWGHYVREVLKDEAYGLNDNFNMNSNAFNALQPQLISNVAFITLNASAPAAKGNFEPCEFFHSQKEGLFRSYVYDDAFKAPQLRGAYITDIFKVINSETNTMPIDSNSGNIKEILKKKTICEEDNYDILYNELKLLGGGEPVFLIPMMVSLVPEYCKNFVKYVESSKKDGNGMFRIASEPLYHYSCRQGKQKILDEMSRRLQCALEELYAWKV